MVRAFGVGFSGSLATPGWGLGSVCLDTRLGRLLPFLAGVRGVCVCGFGLCLHSSFLWVGCWALWPVACAAFVLHHLLVGLPVAWGCAGVAVGWVCPSPSPLVSFVSGCGGGVWFPALSCCGFVVSAAACPGLGSLGLRPTFPFWFRLRACLFFFVLPATFTVGCVPACAGCPFPRWAAALGWVSPALAGRSFSALLGGPVGVAFRVAWLGVLPASWQPSSGGTDSLPGRREEPTYAHPCCNTKESHCTKNGPAALEPCGELHPSRAGPVQTDSPRGYG